MINDLQKNWVVASKVIEKDQRLSQSILWDLQSRFYQESGISAWNKGVVPSYITNNPYIAETYTRMVRSFYHDRPIKNSQEPVYILELGAGSGRFAYYFLHHFFTSIQDTSLKDIPFVYILSDLAESNLAFWQNHPLFQSFIQSGQLDFACFDPVQSSEIHLRCSGKTISAGSCSNSMVVLGNYFLDSLPVDLYSVHNGLLCEGLVTISTSRQDIEILDPAIVPTLEVGFTTRFAAQSRYSDDLLSQLLEIYRQKMEGSFFLFPIGDLLTIRKVIQYSSDQTLFICADKGEYRLEKLRTEKEPEVALHGRGISMSVNFHALASYCELTGGESFQTKHREDGLVFSVMLFGDEVELDKETRAEYRMTLEASNPDDFFMMKKTLEPHYPNATLEQMLAFLRLSGDDPQIFTKMYPALLDRVQSADNFQQDSLFEAICRIRDLYFPIGEPFDLFLALAKIFMILEQYREALDCLQRSRDYAGNSPEKDELWEECARYEWMWYSESV